MAKKQKAIRGKFSDEKYLGPEPILKGTPTNSQVINAYSWYNYFYDAEKAKSWIMEYLREYHKSEKELLKHVTRIPTSNISSTVGWNCRIVLMGGSLPENIRDRIFDRIRDLAARDTARAAAGIGDSSSNGDEGEEAKVSNKKEDSKKERKVISIQERVANRTNELIGELEIMLDEFYRNDTVFRPNDWLIQKDVKPAIAQRIAEYYKPLYAEIYDAYQGKDSQLKEGYSSWKKTKLKIYLEFVKSIVSAAETRATLVKTRTPRKKKEKTPVQLVAKLKYKESDETYSIQSARAVDIPGCNQLWVFNTKYRTLAVYNALGPAGIGVKGSTLTGFDAKTSIVKKLRKPSEQLNKLKDGGKIVLRKLMSEIKCKEKEANGRINKDTILVRIVK